MALISKRFAGNTRIEQTALNNPPMRRGESGEAVRLIQQSLIDLNFPLPLSTAKYGTVDGDYGAETKDKIKDFQRKYKPLTDDGVVGQNTITRMDALISTLPRAQEPLPRLPTSDDDRVLDMVASTLLSAVAREIEFSLFVGTVHKGTIGNVGLYVTRKKIHVRFNPGLATAKIGARYIGASNVMEISRITSDYAIRAQIVHEALHAAFDIHSSRLTAVEEEAIAYVAQCWYLQRVTKSNTLPGTNFEWKSIALHAWPIALAKRNRTDVTRSEFDNLLTAVRHKYAHLNEHMRYVRDGVR